MLIVVIQKDDYFFEVTKTLDKEFEVFLNKQLETGSVQAERLHAMWATHYQDKFGVVALDVKKTLSAIKAVPTPPKEYQQPNKDPTANETTKYGCIVENILYIGGLESLVIAFHPSEAATKRAALKLLHIQDLKAIINPIKLKMQ